MLSNSSSKVAFFLAALVASVKGAPTAAHPLVNVLDTATSSLFTFTPESAQTKDCNFRTWVFATSSASPLVSDCQTLAANIGGGGEWTVGEDNQRQLASYGTCKFGVTVNSGFWAYIGNEDIIYIINNMILNYAYDGRVGASGLMDCWSAEGYVDGAEVLWGLY